MLDRRCRAFAVMAILAAVPPPQPASAADLPPDLALVPADAAGFVHVRVGDAIRSDHLKDLRDLIHRAGPKALATFSKRFTPPDPLSFDRVTLYALPPGPDDREPLPVVVFRVSRPFDRDRLAKALLPGGTPVTAGGLSFVRDEAKDVALRVVDDQTFLICPSKALERVAAAKPRADGPLAPALKLAAGGRVMVAAVSAAALPPGALDQAPPPLRPLAQAKLATLSVELAALPKVELRLRFADGDAAATAEESVRGLVKMAEGGLAMAKADLEQRLRGDGGPGKFEDLPEAAMALLGLGGIGQAEEFLKALPLKRAGAELSLAVEVPAGLQAQVAVAGAVLPALMLPAMQKVRAAASRSQASNNLKQMALAMHNHNDAYQGKLPAHAIYSKGGKPLLSWRVAILPYIEEDQLYRQFKLDEPWDSEHNKKLIPLMPKIYLAPNAPPTREPGMTYYQIFVGGGAPWERGPKQPSIPRTFVDGTSNTIMIAEAGDPVVWSKPDDLPYDPDKPLPKLGNVWNKSGFLVALADGSVRSISPTISEKTLRAAITAAGNETLGPDW